VSGLAKGEFDLLPHEFFSLRVLLAVLLVCKYLNAFFAEVLFL
jgi:hypothetical protein